VFLVCFSVISRVSFQNVTSWMAELTHYAPNVPVVLVGTKIDLRTNPELLSRLASRKETMVTYEEGVVLAEELKCETYCECSALTQKGLAEMFTATIQAAMEPKKLQSKYGKNKRNNNACEIL
jgi:GTPase SAR1 family protein